MNPLFFLIARAYSSGFITLDRSYRNHKNYVKTIIETPIALVEHEVELYFSTLYKNLDKSVFHRPAASVSFFDDENEGGLELDEDS
jgi:hypothetical protein